MHNPAATEFRERRRGARGAVGVAIDEHHIGARLGQCHRHGAAQALGGAGHKCDAAGQVEERSRHARSQPGRAITRLYPTPPRAASTRFLSSFPPRIMIHLSLQRPTALSPPAPPMKRTLSLSFLIIALPLLAAEPPEGVVPLGADGKPLNVDFETGDLRDWTATGDAFKGQPI